MPTILLDQPFGKRELVQVPAGARVCRYVIPRPIPFTRDGALDCAADVTMTIYEARPTGEFEFVPFGPSARLGRLIEIWRDDA